jgi:CRP/FNR family transcriptional regulator, polysaccharide utilization system transcription regulator
MNPGRTPNPNIIKASEIDLLFDVCGEKSLISIKKDQLIFSEGSKPDGLYFLQKGSIRIFRKAEGRESTLAIAGKGTYFGLGSLMRSKNHTCSAVALKDSTVCFIAGKEFMRLTAKYPEVAHQLLVKLCHMLDKTGDKVIFKTNQKVSQQKSSSSSS